MIKLKALLLEQDQPAAQGGETVGAKLSRIWNEIAAMLRTDVKPLLDKNKYFKDNKATIQFQPTSKGDGIRFAVWGSDNKPFTSNVGTTVFASTTLPISIAQAQDYDVATIQKNLTTSGGLWNNWLGLTTNKGLARLQDAERTAFTNAMAKLAPLVTEFANTAINTFPDKKGTARFDPSTWSQTMMITGYQNPVTPAPATAAAATPPAQG
jgi:hypothetical protein